MVHVIYGLTDPITGQIRYIGYTSDPLKRYREHHATRELSSPTHKNNWIKLLMSRGLKPGIIILAEYPTAAELPQAEIEIIAQFRSQGANLTNATKGGDGGATMLGKHHSDDTKRKMSKIKIGNLSFTGRQHSEETKKKMRESSATRKLSIELVNSLLEDPRSNEEIAHEHKVHAKTISRWRRTLKRKQCLP